MWVWKKFEHGEMGELIIVCGIEEKDRKTAERMMEVAFWSSGYSYTFEPIPAHVGYSRGSFPSNTD